MHVPGHMLAAHMANESNSKCTLLEDACCAVVAGEAVHSHKLGTCSWVDTATTALPSSDTTSCFQLQAPPILSMTKPLGSLVKLLLAALGCCACFDAADSQSDSQ